MSTPQEKRELEKKVWEAAFPMLDLLPNTTKEGHAEYMRLKRQLEKKVSKEPFTFKSFLLHYDISREELLKVLDLPMFGENPFRFKRKKK